MTRNSIRGWIQVPRELIRHPINLQKIGLYNVLAAWANFRPSEVEWRGQKVVLQPGQLVSSFRELTKSVNAHRDTVKKALLDLQDDGLIAVEITKKGIRVQVKKFCHTTEFDLDSGTKTTHQEDLGESGLYHECVSDVPQVVQNLPHKKKEKKEKNSFSQIFENVWAMWPLKIAKQEALDRFNEQIQSEEKANRFAIAAKKYLAYLRDQEALNNFKQQPRQLQYFLGVKSKKTKPWEGYIDYVPQANEDSISGALDPSDDVKERWRDVTF